MQGPQIIPGQWNFVAVTVDRSSGQAIFYTGIGTNLNLPLTGHIPLGANATNNLSLLIGQNPLNPKASISIDELEIFKGVLPPTLITQIFKAGKKGKCQKNNPPD